MPFHTTGMHSPRIGWRGMCIRRLSTAQTAGVNRRSVVVGSRGRRMPTVRNDAGAERTVCRLYRCLRIHMPCCDMAALHTCCAGRPCHFRFAQPAQGALRRTRKGRRLKQPTHNHRHTFTTPLILAACRQYGASPWHIAVVSAFGRAATFTPARREAVGAQFRR